MHHTVQHLRALRPPVPSPVLPLKSTATGAQEQVPTLSKAMSRAAGAVAEEGGGATSPGSSPTGKVGAGARAAAGAVGGQTGRRTTAPRAAGAMLALERRVHLQQEAREVLRTGVLAAERGAAHGFRAQAAAAGPEDQVRRRRVQQALA